MKKEKMQGLWVIDEDKSVIERTEKKDMGNTFCIKKRSVNLPCVFSEKLNVDSMMTEDERLEMGRKRCKERDENRHGSFYFPDSNADSVVFEAPNNPLVGRYRIQIWQEGQYRFMLLSNDSTYLLCGQNTFYLW